MLLSSRLTGAICAALFLAACRPASQPAQAVATPVHVARPDPLLHTIVPAPASLTLSGGDPFVVSASTSVVLDMDDRQIAAIAELMASVFRPSTGHALPIVVASPATSRVGAIIFRLAPDRSLGAEGYTLTVTRDSIRILASEGAGFFYAAQSLRQLLPPVIESHMTLERQRWMIPALHITDRPRFAWRGAMLDVARHFFTVKEVKQYIDLLALYKLNVFHLHLSDDQGWRLEIKSRPELVRRGSVSQVGGGAGGFYTQDEFTEIVRYARERFITVVPEIDMPGHTNAALVAYPQLSCSRRPSAIYTGVEVGWSTFCVEKEDTYALIDDIVREIAALAPGAYFHMGGDEVEVLSPAQYAAFVERVQEIVARHGKLTVGWEEIAKARLRPSTLVQNWRTDSAGPATSQGAKLILSPSVKMYLDMKYTAGTELGLQWAALIEVRDAYEWDPASYLKGATEADIVGVEAPLWSETIRNITAAMHLAVPRLPTLAEVAWTPQSARQWEDFRRRIAAHAPRWRLLGINFHPSPQIPWW